MQLTHLSFIIGWNGYCLSLENKVVSLKIKQVFCLLNRLTFHWEWNNKGFWQFARCDSLFLVRVSFFSFGVLFLELVIGSIWCILLWCYGLYNPWIVWTWLSLMVTIFDLLPNALIFIVFLVFGFYLFLPPTLIFLALFSAATLESFWIRFYRRS